MPGWGFKFVMLALQLCVVAVATLLWARVRDNRATAERARDELARLHEALPRTYVLKDDYVRTMASFDRKLDQVHAGVSWLRQQQAKGEGR